MALIYSSSNCTIYCKPLAPKNPNFKFNPSQLSVRQRQPRRFCVVNEDGSQVSDNEEDSVGVKAALSMLRFYKREISPLLPKSCRYVPTCSEYSMIAYKKYGFVKGTVLMTWRVCRCNPLGGSGFDPPRWFDETTPPEE